MDDIIKKYVERVLEVRERHTDDLLSEEELREIARDIGLTDAELDAIDRRVNDSAERAVGFMNHALWDDAIREWEEALTFAPSRVAYRAKLAQCYATRRKSGDADLARALAESVLEREPSNQSAYEVLRSLEMGDTKRKILIPILGAMFVVGLVVMVGVLLMTFLLVSTDDPDTSTVTAVDGPILANDDPNKNFKTQKIGDYPIEISTPEGIEVFLFKSQYDIYEDKSFYKLTANVENNTDREITEIKGTFVYTLKDGNTVSKNLDILGSHESEMRPGDRHPFSELHQVANTLLESASLKVTIAESVAAGDYPKPEPVDLKWGEGISKDRYKLEVFERSESLGTPSVIGRFHKVAWEFHNKGPAIKTLKVQVDYFDKANEKITGKSFLVAYSGTPPIEPNEKRSDNTIQKIENGKEFDHYELSVIEIK